MDGLEAVEIKLSELERTNRIDSEFYRKENLIVLDLLKKKKHALLTDNFYVSDGNHMSISNDFRQDGIRYYRGADIYNFFIEEASPIFISEESFNLPVMKRSHLKKGDILMSIVGAIIGNIALVRTDEKQTCSCKLAIFRPRKGVDSTTAAVYLKTHYAQNQIQKFRRGAAQTGFLLEDADQIVIPEFSDDFCKIIAKTISKMNETLQKSTTVYNDAESCLLSALGMDTFAPSQEPVSVKMFSDSFGVSGRLDAEYYQRKYEDYSCAITKQFHTFVYKEFELVRTSCSREKAEYPYIEIGDINVDNGSFSYNTIKTDELPDNAKICPTQGDLLVSKVRPYRGAVAILCSTIKDLIVSGAFTVLRPKSVYPIEVLAVLLRSAIYRDWFMKWNVGSSYPVIRDDDVINMPIPILETNIQTKIVDNVQQSFEFRRQSEQLLHAAKRAVEIAIESGEDMAIKSLKERKNEQ